MVTYKKLMIDNSKVQVDSAIRDGDGQNISTTYAKSADVASTYATKTEVATDYATKTEVTDGLQLKQDTITGGASSVASNDLTANRALVSNQSGKITVSPITFTELGYLDNATSNIQTQLNGKQAKLTQGTGITISGNTISATVSAPTWGNISGTLSNQTDLQTALNAKANTSDLPSSSELVPDTAGASSGNVLTLDSNLTPVWQTGGGSGGGENWTVCNWSDVLSYNNTTYEFVQQKYRIRMFRCGTQGSSSNTWMSVMEVPQVSWTSQRPRYHSPAIMFPYIESSHYNLQFYVVLTNMSVTMEQYNQSGTMQTGTSVLSVTQITSDQALQQELNNPSVNNGTFYVVEKPSS